MITTRAFRISTNDFGKAAKDYYYPRIAWFGSNLSQNILLVDPTPATNNQGLFQIAFSEFFCTFVFCLAAINLLYQMEKAGNKQNSFYMISVAFVYMSMLALDYPIATGVLNPALGTALTTQGHIWTLYTEAINEGGENKFAVSMIKCLVPFIGGLFAGLVFLYQRKLLYLKILYPT
jgi:glycerol uptake facilitator-like aquaporin